MTAKREPTTAISSSNSFAAAIPPLTSFTTAYPASRSSSFLSSSFRPFYPRAHQPPVHPHSSFVGFHNGDCQGSLQLPDDANASQSHFSSWAHTNDIKFYDQQYYSNMEAEPCELSWVPADGTLWDSSTWQHHWFDPAEYTHTDDDAVDSAICSSNSVSYYTASHNNMVQDKSVCASSNTLSTPFSNNGTQLLACHVNEVRKSDLYNGITEVAAMPKVFDRVILPEESRCPPDKLKQSSLLNNMETKGKEVSGYGHNLCSDEKKEVVNSSMDSALDLNLSASQVTIQTTSGFGTFSSELKRTQDLVEHVQAKTESNMLEKASCNLKSEQQKSADVISTKDHVHLTPDVSMCSNNSYPNSSAVSMVTGTHEKAQNAKSESHHTDMHENKGFCGTMAYHKPAIANVIGQMNDVEELSQGQKDSGLMQHDDVRLCSNGPHVLIECIHNLSKVLLLNRSKGSVGGLDLADCLLLENTIRMLSRRLLQCTITESNSYQDPNSQLHLAERETNISDNSTKSFTESASLQKTSHQISNLNQILDFISNFECQMLQNVHRSTHHSSVGVNESSHLANLLEGLQKELRVLEGEMKKLQQEVVYEHSESNVTVSIYKDLWSEAQDALKVSRAEVEEMRGELSVVKQELTNLKLSGGAISANVLANDENGLKIKQLACENSATIPCHKVMASGLPRVSMNDNVKNTDCARFQEGLEVGAGCVDEGPLANHSSCTPFVKLEGFNAEHIKCASSSGGISEAIMKRSLNPTFIPANLEMDVAQRLSLLLSRKGLDLNKSCTEGSVQEALGSEQMILESSTKGLGRNEMIFSDEKNLSCFETSCPCPVNHNHGFGVCHQTPAFRAAASPHNLIEREFNDAGGDVIEPVGIFEDDIEIICLKPGAMDGNFTYLTSGSEWEDVFVTAVNDHALAKEMD